MKRSFFREYQWHLIVVLWGVALVLSLVGFGRHAALHGLQNTFWDNLYLTLQLIPMNSGAVAPPVPLELGIARFLIPLLTGITALKALWGLLHDQIRSLRLKRLSNHILVCGLSRKGYLLASQFRRQGDEVVIIERDEENDWLESCRQQGMFVLVGDATDPEMLRQAGVPVARRLFAVCDQDGINAEIIVQAHSLVRSRSDQPLICLGHITDPQLCALLRENEKVLESTPFRVDLFNVYELGARKLLQQYPAWSEASLRDGHIPHILVVGVGRMGENLVVQAARDWRRQQSEIRAPLKISVLDREALRKTESMRFRYPTLSEVCELIPLEMDIRSTKFERAEFLSDEKGYPCLDQIYICLDNDALGLQAGLALARRAAANPIPVVIRMAEETGLARLLEIQKNKQATSGSLVAFGLLNRTCTTDLLLADPVDILAQAAHVAYVQQQFRAGAIEPGDPSLQPWEKLDPEYKKANYHWVERVSTLISSVGYKIVYFANWEIPNFEFKADELEAMAKLEHRLWCEERLRDGWNYAPGSKSLADKTNPNLVDWEKLPANEQELSYLFVRRLPELIESVGFHIAPAK